MQSLKFAVVGGVGFLFDAMCFYLLLKTGMDSTFARVIAFWFAAVITWLGNRLFTFNGAKIVSAFQQLTKHMLSAHFSGVVNISCYYLISLTQSLSVAFVVGIVAGALFNYWLSCRYVFVAESS